MNKVQVLVGVIFMFLGTILVFAGAPEQMSLNGFGSCLSLFLLLAGLFLTITGINIPKRRIG